MDFFQQQDKAKSKTGRLVFLFIFAVILVIFAVYAAIMGVVAYNDPHTGFYNPELFLVIAGVTFAVICLGSLFKIAALSKGGGYVAEGLGGKLVSPGTNDPDQRKLLNVVEEMAIASGVPVPPVYLLEGEEGINAFAAGFSPNDAVIGVTKGCCQRLNRDELQGVIAHEFSHILNGDMRLNIRLIGFLGGIMVIATIGNTILRGSGSRHRSYSSRKSGKGGGGQIVLIALLLLVIGYVGLLIGRLIQSAVSRQREYLADASAVQFTRSTAIANALKKIGGLSVGAKIKSPAAGEACHMFFGKAISSFFATHPPLIDRIQKIDPGFSGDFAAIGAAGPAAGIGTPQPFSSFQAGREVAIDADRAMERVGNITPENVAYSAAIIDAVPQTIKNETGDILGASAVVCSLLLDRDSAKRKDQLDMLGKSAPPALLRQMEVTHKHVSKLPADLRLPVLDLSIPALRQMSPEQFTAFSAHLQTLIQADNKITLFEFILQTIINRRLTAAFINTNRKILYKSMTPLIEDTISLLTLLARAGHKEAGTMENAFQAGIAALPIKKNEITLSDKVTFKTLYMGLERISQASAGVKKSIFDACCQCVLYDGKVALSEAELLRAVAYAVDIPVPPFLSASA